MFWDFETFSEGSAGHIIYRDYTVIRRKNTSSSISKNLHSPSQRKSSSIARRKGRETTVNKPFLRARAVISLALLLRPSPVASLSGTFPPGTKDVNRCVEFATDSDMVSSIAGTITGHSYVHVNVVGE